KRGYMKDNWLDYALIVLFVLTVGVAYQYRRNMFSAGALFVIITQVYLLAMLVLRAVSANLRLAGSGLPPSWLLIGSFAAMCLIGSGLLMLPAAVRPEFHARWFYDDALFTATSATCITGLVVAETGRTFTLFGQAVILVLIQLGGLGIMIFGTMLALLTGRALSMRGSETVGEMLESDRIGDLRRIVRFIVVVTFVTEAIGVLLLFGMFTSPGALNAWGEPMSTGSGIWYSVFHSISAFCNAGFSLYPENMMQGVGGGGWTVPLRGHWEILGVMAPLIVLGGLGFPVLSDGLGYLRSLLVRIFRRIHRKSPTAPLPRAALSLHSRIVLTATVLLIALGAAGLALLEIRSDDQPGGNIHGRSRPGVAVDDWEAMSTGKRTAAMVFQSITARTAGFNTIDMNQLTNGGKLWMCGLMTIGGSPAGTAGGLKTVTVAMLVLAGWCVLRRREHLEAFHRSIPEILLRRAITIVLLYMTLLIAVTLLLCVAMRDEKLIDLLFEASSACGTVGLSTGITSRLEVFGKLVIIGGMFIGRIGPLTLLLALTVHMKNVEFSYPSENVVIG
ncbi:MAG: hypothetical protein KAJ01_04235, partial [Candidatus Hydrogenedentes bacterium]|nr:hypothetical protein [Candidatus Hydrogenedentota bacterium]